eukprot:TRINITY_DN53673_c0_g1_i1.p1 TRINITY_DN53673_c0_g1~~TRINITY_DN53673_c0_g1_i1.p1  ORF type:complete len:1091 (-),score=169.64 TRINITY_DN53673_c0_g1_i1:56-3271(-)
MASTGPKKLRQATLTFSRILGSSDSTTSSPPAKPPTSSGASSPSPKSGGGGGDGTPESKSIWELSSDSETEPQKRRRSSTASEEKPSKLRRGKSHSGSPTTSPPVTNVFTGGRDVKQEEKEAKELLLKPVSAKELLVPVNRKEKERPDGAANSKPCVRAYSYAEATAVHPFIDKSHYHTVVTGSHVLRDAKGNVMAVFVKNAFPPSVRQLAAEVLRTAARPTSLRSAVCGGSVPLSGIAGYYDYAGSPIEFKCRKTSFTFDHIGHWPKVFPFVEYANELYRQLLPTNWAAQNAAIPDVTRIRGSVFSTLTVNQRFRTAKHTDAGDFDDGFGLLTVLEGDYRGMHLGFTDFHVCFDLRPGDLLLFNTHCWHGNTEPESGDIWNRLSVVMYYRARLGEENCMKNYFRRKEIADKNPALQPKRTENGTNLNSPVPGSPLPAALRSLLKGVVEAIGGRGSTASLDRLLRLLMDVPGLGADLLEEQQHQIRPCRRPQTDYTSLEERLMHAAGSAIAALGLGHASMPSEGSFANYIGGFHLSKFGSKAGSLIDDVLAHPEDELDHLEGSLADEFRKLRDEWIRLVLIDWRRANCPDKFTWNNRGSMNSAFFKCCDAMKELMLLVYGKQDISEVTAFEQQQFEATFACHLARKCVHQHKMPATAMTLTKLDVKLKDYHHGGTRYFKDFDEETQKAMLARRERLRQMREAAARQAAAVLAGETLEDGTVLQGGGPTRPKTQSAWLLNDTFDYQTEDAPVNYAKLEIPPPPSHPPEPLRQIQNVRQSTDKDVAVSILVISPLWAEANETWTPVAVTSTGITQHAGRPPQWRAVWDALAAQFAAIPEGARYELRRILDAALPQHFLLPRDYQPVTSLQTYNDLPTSVNGLRRPKSGGKLPDWVHLRRVGSTQDELAAFLGEDYSEPASYDLIVLSHVLHTIPQAELPALLEAVRSRLSDNGLLLVKEFGSTSTDFFRLVEDKRPLYDAGANLAFATVEMLRNLIIGAPAPVDEDNIGRFQDTRFWQARLEDNKFATLGIHHVPHSALNEFYLCCAKAFANQIVEQDTAVTETSGPVLIDED